MPNQVLVIEPQNELKFKVDASGKFEHGYTTYMKLCNPSRDVVLFKIKTTAPKKYCVRPNSGILEPNEKVDIAITPQPVYVEANEKHKHKFMVQSVVAQEDWSNIDKVWKDSTPQQLMDYKLKCVFETPEGIMLNDAGDSTGNDGTKKRVVVADEKPVAPPKEGVVVQSDVKRKDAEEPKSPGKVAGKPESMTDNNSTDLQKTASEISQLREEENKLRQENLKLKEELLHYRQLREGKPVSPHVYGPEKTANAPFMPWVVVAVGMAIVGIIMGKFFL